MRSDSAQGPSWPVCQICGTSHNSRWSAEAARQHFMAAPAGWKKPASRSTLRNRVGCTGSALESLSAQLAPRRELRGYTARTVGRAARTTHRSRELTGRSKTRDGDVRPWRARILRIRALGFPKAWQRRREDRRNSGQLGRLCETGGYPLLNNG
jgi:hypothetical protein